jgi:hypothetical protein
MEKEDRMEKKEITTCTVGGERKNIGASVGWWVPEGFSHGWKHT